MNKETRASLENASPANDKLVEQGHYLCNTRGFCFLSFCTKKRKDKHANMSPSSGTHLLEQAVSKTCDWSELHKPNSSCSYWTYMLKPPLPCSQSIFVQPLLPRALAQLHRPIAHILACSRQSKGAEAGTQGKRSQKLLRRGQDIMAYHSFP